MKKSSWIITKFVAAVQLLVLIVSPSVSAVTSIFPDTGNTNHLSVVSKPGNGIGMTADISNYKVYTTLNGAQSGTSTLTIVDFCYRISSGWVNQDAVVRVYENNTSELKMDSTPEATGTVSGATNASGITPGCNANSGRDMQLNIFLDSGNRSSINGHTQYFTYTVEIEKTTAGGINGYKLSVNPSLNSFVSYVEDDNPEVAGFPTPYGFGILSSRFLVAPREETSYTLRFALDCSITANTRVWLKWSDADYGRSNELNGIRWELWDDTTGGIVHSRGNEYLMYRQSSPTPWGWSASPSPYGTGTGVQDFQADYRTTFLVPNHNYRWVWYGVDNQNGLQIWMPYPEVNFGQTCGSWTYNARVLSSSQTVEPLDTISIIADAQNTGTITGANNYSLEITPSQNASYVSTSTLSPDAPATPDGSWSNKTARWNETVAIPGGGNSGDRTANYIVNANTPNGTQICFTSTVSPSSISAGSHTSAPRCFTVVVPERPYIEVEGADIWAGGLFADQDDFISNFACSSGTGGTPAIIRGVEPNANFGPMTSFGLFATGTITGFGSNKVLGGSELTFANTANPLGNFSTDGRCITNYYELFANEPETQVTTGANVGSLDGQYIVNGNLMIGGSGAVTINLGTQVLLLVNGNVTITNNIVYPTNYVALSTSQVPMFMLIARGNINITGNVSRLDGAYIAIPSDEANPTNGIINTCSNAPAQITLGSVCDNQLVINGIFTAQDIQFLRVSGGLNRGGAAENFEFTPELYLGEPNFSSRYFTNFTTDQFKDLPPIY